MENPAINGWFGGTPIFYISSQWFVIRPAAWWGGRWCQPGCPGLWRLLGSYHGFTVKKWWFNNRCPWPIYAYYILLIPIIFQASDLGLVKDTPVWPSPISSCVGPPLHKSQLIRCPYKIRNYVWFFLVRHGPLVKPWCHRTCSPLVTYDFVHQVLCVYVM